MRVRKARALGFCFGVRRALQIVERAVADYGPIDSLGSIVHNPQVVEGLSRKGVALIHALDEARNGTVAITAHGVGPHVYHQARARGLNVVDTTCPIVRRSQRAAYRLNAAGFQVVIYGDADHPEVQGVLTWCGERGIAIQDPEADIVIPRRKVALLAQTTKSGESFVDFVGRFLAKHMSHINEVRIINTTCPETEERYRAAAELARAADLLIVVGGKNSANTRKLAATCAAIGVETHHIEQADELDPAWLQDKELVGVTAGASTPDQAVSQVVTRLRELSRGPKKGGNGHGRDA